MKIFFFFTVQLKRLLIFKLRKKISMNNSFFFQIISDRFRMNSPGIYDEYQSDRNDSQSDELYTTPISPLSPQEKSPPAPTPATVSSPTNYSIEQKFESNAVKEMQILLHSSADLSFPLQDSWSFWYFKNGRMGDWKDNLIHITTISTVEAFWSVFNHLQSPSRLEQGCDYFLFKIHIVSRMKLLNENR